MWLLDLTGILCSLVLLLTSLRLLEVGRRAELSLRSAIALFVGAGAGWSLVLASWPGSHLHAAHVLVLFSGACWVGQAVWRHRFAPLHHPGRRATDFGELDSLATKGTNHEP